MNESFKSPSKNFSLMKIYKEYNPKTGLSFWKKFKMYCTLRNYPTSKKLDYILQTILDNQHEIMKITADENIDIYLRGRICIYLEHGEQFCIFYRDHIQNIWDQCNIMTDKVNIKINKYTGVMPSRKMLIKFIDFLCRRGIIEI